MNTEHELIHYFGETGDYHILLTFNIRHQKYNVSNTAAVTNCLTLTDAQSILLVLEHMAYDVDATA